MALPSFSESGTDAKLTPLEKGAEPRRAICQWLSRVAEGRDPSSLRVLDVGCGRGDTVAWLLEQGFNASGLDVRPEYIANGRNYIGADRLALLDGPSYPYPDGHFDIVMSDQVFEHVSDLQSLVAEVARTTKPGGVGLHVFPAKWRFVEPHLHAPIVHWLPKGRIRRRAIRLALQAGATAPYFTDQTLDDRTSIFSKYSDLETFYRPPAEVRSSLENAGLSVDLDEISREQLLYKLGISRLPGPVDRAAVWAYRTTKMVYLSTVNTGRRAATQR